MTPPRLRKPILADLARFGSSCWLLASLLRDPVLADLARRVGFWLRFCFAFASLLLRFCFASLRFALGFAFASLWASLLLRFWLGSPQPSITLCVALSVCWGNV